MISFSGILVYTSTAACQLLEAHLTTGRGRHGTVRYYCTWWCAWLYTSSRVLAHMYTTSCRRFLDGNPDSPRRSQSLFLHQSTRTTPKSNRAAYESISKCATCRSSRRSLNLSQKASRKQTSRARQSPPSLFCTKLNTALGRDAIRSVGLFSLVFFRGGLNHKAIHLPVFITVSPSGS